MIKEEFKNKLIEVFKEDSYGLDINGLISFMETSEIEYLMADLRGPMGMATIDGVYIDFNKVTTSIYQYYRILYFVILHETAHVKRIKKMGKDVMLQNLSLSEFDEFFEHVINEELIADRYACIMFYKLNKIIYPQQYTQNLQDTDNKERYKNTARGFFGQIQNDETKYKEFFNRFIKKIY